MNNKKITVIPPICRFKQNINIKGDKIKTAIFIPKNSESDNLYAMKTKLCRFNYFECICLFTYDINNKKSVNGMKKLLMLCKKEKIDMIVCCSVNDFLENQSDQLNINNYFTKYAIPVYFINDCILFKDNKFILLK